MALLDDRRDPERMSSELSLHGGDDLRWVLESCEGSDPRWRLIATSDPLRPARAS